MEAKNKRVAYRVFTSVSEYDDYTEYTIFVTYDLKLAKKYVDKFNEMLFRWRDYFCTLEDLTPEQDYKMARLDDQGMADFEEVEIRG